MHTKLPLHPPELSHLHMWDDTNPTTTPSSPRNFWVLPSMVQRSPSLSSKPWTSQSSHVKLLVQSLQYTTGIHRDKSWFVSTTAPIQPLLCQVQTCTFTLFRAYPCQEGMVSNECMIWSVSDILELHQRAWIDWPKLVCLAAAICCLLAESAAGSCMREAVEVFATSELEPPRFSQRQWDDTLAGGTARVTDLKNNKRSFAYSF